MDPRVPPQGFALGRSAQAPPTRRIRRKDRALCSAPRRIHKISGVEQEARALDKRSLSLLVRSIRRTHQRTSAKRHDLFRDRINPLHSARPTQKLGTQTAEPLVQGEHRVRIGLLKVARTTSEGVGLREPRLRPSLGPKTHRRTRRTPRDRDTASVTTELGATCTRENRVLTNLIRQIKDLRQAELLTLIHVDRSRQGEKEPRLRLRAWTRPPCASRWTPNSTSTGQRLRASASMSLGSGSRSTCSCPRRVTTRCTS